MKKREKKVNVPTNIGPGTIIVGIVATIILYLILINYEKQALTDYEKGSIYVAMQNIPKGTMIESDNYSEYFEQKELDKNVIPKTAITSPEQLLDLAAEYTIDEGTLITFGMFKSVEDITKDMSEPVIAGFRAEDLYQVVGGTLRAGDRIHIYQVNEEDTATLIWSNVYVQQVFDNSGTNITNDNTTTAAQRINVYMDTSEVERFYSELAAGSLRVVKVCD